MSIYSYTKITELSASYISTRTCNICRERNMHTVKDVWDYYASYRNFRHINQVGKKGAAQLLRISRKAAGVMSVMPLTATAEAPAWKQGFSLVALYASLNEEGKQIAENVFARFVGHLRATGQRKLEDMCGDLTLPSFLHTMHTEPKLFQLYTTTARSYRSEIGRMIQALYRFFQSDLYTQYMEKPRLTLLRQEMHKAMGCLNQVMDDFLVRHGEKLTEETFPLGSFIEAVIRATTKLPAYTKNRWRNALYAGVGKPQLIVKMCVMLKESNFFDVLQPAIALLEKYGYTMPAHYYLQDAPYYTSHYSGTANYNDSGALFITLLYNPAYGVATYKKDGWPHILLVKSELLEQFDVTGFLREVNALKNECIHEAYTIDLLSLMGPYFDAATTDEEEEKLMRIVAAMLEDVYSLSTNSEGNLELKRTSKKQTWEHVLDVLTDRGRPGTTREIAEELRKRGVNVMPETVRNNMADHKDLFNHTDSNDWGLRTWKKTDRVVERTDSYMMIVE